MPELRELHGLEGKAEYVKVPARSQSLDATDVTSLVASILKDVQLTGDSAVRRYSEKFDGVSLDQFEVTKAERLSAVERLDRQTREDTEFAIENVRRFAEAQLSTILPLDVEPLPGLHLGHRVIPIEKVGAYVPGGVSRFSPPRS